MLMAMYKLQRYIANSDFATLKNDASGQMDLHITGNFTIPAGGKRIFAVETELGTKNAPLRALMCSSKNSKWQPCPCIEIILDNVVTGGATSSYPTIACVERISDKILRLSCTIVNFNLQGEMHVGSNDQVITAKVATFKSPFEL